MEENPTDKYLQLWKELDDHFLNWKSLFLDIRDYVLPRRGKFIDGGESPEGGEKRHSKILNGTASRCLRLGAAGIHGHLTSPARPWFRLLPPDLKMLKSSGVRQWLQYIERLIYNIYAKTNFYQCVHSIYQEEMAFGTGVLYQEEDPTRICRFSVMTAGEYRLATNDIGEVDTVARLFYMTVRQVAQRFDWEKISLETQQLLEKTPNESIKILHIVRPNKDRKSDKIDKANKPFESVYLEYDNCKKFGGTILDKSGYEENPFTCPRWDVISNEAYGVSPAHDLLGEIKTLQVMRKDVLEALHKTIDPPLNVPTTMKDTLNRLPGGINWVDPGSGEGVKAVYQINFDIQSTKADMREVEQDIREGFYNDLFLMLSSSPGIQPKNMMEIAELQEEKLIMLGPVIERQFSELLNPAIARTFAIMLRVPGLVPAPPPELYGTEIKVEYVSFLAQAQKKIGIQAINATVAFISNLGAIIPDAIDKLDYDQAVDSYAEIVGAPQEIVRDSQKVIGIREARAQQMQQAQQMEQMAALGEGAKAVKSLAGADTSGQNALTNLMQAEENG